MIKSENRLSYYNKKYSFSIEKSQVDNFAKYWLFLGLTAYNLYINIGVKNNYQIGLRNVFEFTFPDQHTIQSSCYSDQMEIYLL